MTNVIVRTRELYKAQNTENTKEHINEIEAFLIGNGQNVNRESIALMIGYIENGVCWKLAEKGV